MDDCIESLSNIKFTNLCFCFSKNWLKLGVIIDIIWCKWKEYSIHRYYAKERTQ